jgi:hypothetical protein
MDRSVFFTSFLLSQHLQPFVVRVLKKTSDPP